VNGSVRKLVIVGIIGVIVLGLGASGMLAASVIISQGPWVQLPFWAVGTTRFYAIAMQRCNSTWVPPLQNAGVEITLDAENRTISPAISGALSDLESEPRLNVTVQSVNTTTERDWLWELPMRQDALTGQWESLLLWNDAPFLITFLAQAAEKGGDPRIGVESKLGYEDDMSPSPPSLTAGDLRAMPVVRYGCELIILGSPRTELIFWNLPIDNYTYSQILHHPTFYYNGFPISAGVVME